MKGLNLQAAHDFSDFFFIIYFAIFTAFGRCFHNLAALRVKLETLSHFQINFAFNLTIRNVFISNWHF